MIVSNMTNYQPDLSQLFHALADPTRRMMLSRLAERPIRVTDLSGPTGLRLPTVMRHLAVLEEAGLIATTKDGRGTESIGAVAVERVDAGASSGKPSMPPE